MEEALARRDKISSHDGPPCSALTRRARRLAAACGRAAAAVSPGTLDIHQIGTGQGNSALSILPDGTTMLLDAGDNSDSRSSGRVHPPPDSSRTPLTGSSATSAAWSRTNRLWLSITSSSPIFTRTTWVTRLPRQRLQSLVPTNSQASRKWARAFQSGVFSTAAGRITHILSRCEAALSRTIAPF